MKQLKIFHGSQFLVQKPLFNYGKANNDYGKGFYCTFDISLAKEWANRYGGYGIANEYLLRIDNLRILDLTSDKYNVLNWIALLLKNRDTGENFRRINKERIAFINKHYIDIKDYDVIIGYRADDAYFRFPIDFINGDITLEQLKTAFKLGYLGKQIVLKSKKSFENIKFIKSHNTAFSNNKAYKDRIEIAMNQYSALTQNRIEGTYIYNLMEKKHAKRR